MKYLQKQFSVLWRCNAGYLQVAFQNEDGYVRGENINCSEDTMSQVMKPHSPSIIRSPL